MIERALALVTTDTIVEILRSGARKLFNASSLVSSGQNFWLNLNIGINISQDSGDKSAEGCCAPFTDSHINHERHLGVYLN